MKDESNLARLRKAAGYQTMKDFAEKIGVKRTTYINYEKDPMKLPLEKAVEIADMFGVSVDEVIGHAPLDEKLYIDLDNLKGRVQCRYDALSIRQRQYIEECLDYAEFRDASRKRAKKNQLKTEYLTKVYRFFDFLFCDEVSRAVFKGATTDTLKAYFEDWLDKDQAAELDAEVKHEVEAMKEGLAQAREKRGDDARLFSPGWATVTRYISSEADIEELAKEYRERRGAKIQSERPNFLQAFDDAVGPDEESLKEAVRIMGPNGSFYEYAFVSL